MRQQWRAPWKEETVPQASQPERKTVLGGLNDNQRAVFTRLANRPATAAELSAELGLTASQVRYALERLSSKGLVDMIGGRGSRKTTYRTNYTEQP